MPSDDPAPPPARAWPGYAALAVVILIVAILIGHEVRHTSQLECVDRAAADLPAPAPADAYLEALAACVR